MSRFVFESEKHVDVFLSTIGSGHVPLMALLHGAGLHSESHAHFLAHLSTISHSVRRL